MAAPHPARGHWAFQKLTNAQAAIAATRAVFKAPAAFLVAVWTEDARGLKSRSQQVEMIAIAGSTGAV